MIEQIVRLDDEGYPIPIADLVRCKDCEHFQFISEGCGGCSRLANEEEQIMIAVSWNDFCSFGKRKDGAE